MQNSTSYIKKIYSNIIKRSKNNNMMLILVSCKVFEVLIKIVIILLLPIIYGFVTTAYIQTFLCIIFLSSPLLIAGSPENWLLKQMTKINLTQKAAFRFVNSSINLAFKLSIFFFLTLYIISFIPINNLPINLIKENWLNIFIGTFSYAMICILSWAFRGLGKIIFSQIFFGLYWPVILIAIMFIDYLLSGLSLSYQNIINIFTFFLFLPVPFYYFIFYRYIKTHLSEEGKFELSKKSQLKNKSKLHFFLESLSNFGIIWSPILIAGFFLPENEVGIFSTNYRIAFGIFTAFIIVNYLSAKKFSELFQKLNLVELSKIFKFFTIISSVLGFLLFFFSLIILFFLEYYTSYIINNYYLIFIILMTFCTFFGPADVLLNMCNQERIHKNILIYALFLLVILFSLSIKFFDLNIGYISIGVVIFIKHWVTYRYSQNKILKY